MLIWPLIIEKFWDEEVPTTWNIGESGSSGEGMERMPDRPRTR